jgi:EmrB/QacA subfamily drug resistance transporter
VLGSGIGFLDSTIVNVALPRMGQELPVRLFGVLEAQSYVYSGYLLTLSSLLILAGALSDFYGRRKMFGFGLAAFGAISALCGLAPNLELLILFRLLQGAAGALLVPGSLSLINTTFSEEERGRAFGIWAGASAATTILGPFLGGVLVDTLSWRVAFLVNVPLVAIGLYAVWRHVVESRDEEATGSFDWVGAALVALAVGGLAFGAIYGEQRQWRDPAALLWIGLGAAGLVALPFWLRRASHPLIPLELFRSRNFVVANAATLLIYGALYVTFYFLTLFLQSTLGYTAAASGLAGVPGSLFLVLFSSRFGEVAGRVGPRWFLAAGPAVMSLGVLWWSRVPADSEPWRLEPGALTSYLPPTSYLTDFLPGSLLFGMGLMLMVAPLTAAVMASVAVHHSGVASAVNNAISRIGPQLAGALVFIAVTSTFFNSLATYAPGVDQLWPDLREHVSPLNPPPPDAPASVAEATKHASADAFHLAARLGAVMLLTAGLVSGLGIPNRSGSVSSSAESAVPRGSRGSWP